MSFRLAGGALGLLALVGCVKIDPGRGASLTLKATQAGFPDTEVGQVSTASITILNDGEFDATSIQSSSLEAPFTLSGNTCGATLPMGASCSLQLSFAPTQAGSSTATLTVSYYDGEKTRTATFAVAGTAIGESLAAVRISETDPYFFVGVFALIPATHDFSLTNSGTAEATALSIGVSGGAGATDGGGPPAPSFSIVNNLCGATLAAGASCNFTVRVIAAAAGAFHGTVAVSYFDGAATQSPQRTLQGIAASAP